MELTRERVELEREWVGERAGRLAALINDVRGELGLRFAADVGEVTEERVRAEIEAVFADGDVAVNVAAMVALLRELDVAEDYPGFVVDELLGRELAATIAGGQPVRLLAEATFHVADTRTHGDPGEPAGLDDLDAALAAGLQSRLPGWAWRERRGPFDGEG